MSKKFNIHDWQAKQAKILLNEEDEWQKRQDRMTPGKNPEYFYDKDSLIGKLKKDPDYIKKINAKAKEDRVEKDDEELAGVKHDMGTMGEHHNDENFPGKNLSSWDLLDKIKASDQELYNRVEDFMKAMDDNKDDSPDWWKDVMAQQPNPDLNEDEIDENSLGSAGAGAEFTGNGMAHLGKKKNKK